MRRSTLGLDMRDLLNRLDTDHLGEDPWPPKAPAQPAPQKPSAVQKAGLLAGGVGLLVLGLGLAAAPIVVAVLIVKAVTK